jgi:hypothetical protein
MIYYFFYKIALFLKSINLNIDRYKYPHETALFIMSLSLTMNILSILLFSNYKSTHDNFKFYLIITIIILFIIQKFIPHKKLDVIVAKYESKKRKGAYIILFNTLFSVYFLLSFYLVYYITSVHFKIKKFFEIIVYL